jgi:biotin carboxylase
MARLLFLGASVSQLPAIRYARETGHAVVACDGDADAIAFEHCDVAEVVDFSDVDAVASVALRERVDGVLAVCTDRAVVPAAAVAERVGLPGIGVVTARAMTNKPAMRARLGACGIPQPAHAVLTAAHALERTPDVALPAVVKPADSGGQRGLFMIERTGELARRLPDALAASRTGEAMLEEYVEGTEVNVLLAVRGSEPTTLVVSDRLRPAGAGFGVGWIHSYPSALPPETLAEIERIASDAVRCLGLRDGIAFAQLIAGAGRTVVVEIAARIAAGQMADLVRCATGIELFEIAIRQAVGDDVPDELVAPRFDRPVAIRFLTASPGVLPVGTVRSITGLDRVLASPGVLDAGVYFGPGATIGPLRVDADRRGYVIATGATAADALEHASAAALRLVVDVGAPRALPARPRRARVLAPAVAAAVLVAAAVAAYLVPTARTVPAKLVAATRTTVAFSPVCGCPHATARIAFRLVARTQLAVDVVGRSGRFVAQLLGRGAHAPGTLHLSWNGRTSRGARAADGTYFPAVAFPALHRTLRLPAALVLDTDRPRVEAATARYVARTIVVRYRFGEPAHAELLVGGRRAVSTPLAESSGTILWPAPRLREALSLVAVDPAGNRSLPIGVRRDAHAQL